MKKSVMYLVVSFGGQWDDAWHQNEWSTLDELSAEFHIIKLKAKQARHNEVVAEIEKFCDARVARVGPRPTVGGYQDYPRWPAGIANSSITEAMRSERDYIKANNARIAEQDRELYNAHDTACEKETVEFLMSLGYKEGDSIMNRYGRCITSANFRIEEIPFGG